MSTDIGSAYFQLIPSMKGFSATVSKELGGSSGIGSKAGAATGKTFTSGFKDIVGGTALGNVLGNAVTGAAKLAAQGVVGLTRAIGNSFATANEWQRLNAQTATVLKSTGNAAGVTSKQIQDLASSLESQTSTESEAIQSGANLLLTFTNIRNEAGKGNDVFNQATATIVDMSRALGQDTSASAIQLGKALNDPIKGVTALQRVGVSFTAQQKEQIKALVDSGHTMQAQKLILAELNKEFGGSGAAYRATFAGQMYQVRDALGDMGATAATAVLPALGLLGGAFATIANKVSTAVMPLLTRLGSSLAVLAPRIGSALAPAVDALAGKLAAFASGGLQKVVTLFETLQRTTANGINFAAVSAAISQVFPGFQNLVNVFNLLTPLAPLIGKALADLGPSIGAILPSLSQAALSLLPALEKVIVALLPVIPPLSKLIVSLAPVISALADVLVFLIDNGLKPTVDMLNAAIGVFTGAVTPSQLLADAFSGKLGPAFQFAADAGRAAGTAIGAVVGAVTGAGAAVGQFLADIGGLPAKAVAALGSIGTTFLASGSSLISGLVQGVTQGVPQFLASVTGLPGKALTALGDVAGKLVTAGGQLIGGLITGVTQNVGRFVSQFSPLGGKAITALGDTAGKLVQSGAQFIGGLIKGVTSKVAEFTATVGALPGKGLTALGAIGSKLLKAGQDFLGGLIKGIVAKTQPFLSTVGAFPGKGLTALGAIGSKLVKAGSDFLGGLIKGVTSKVQPFLSLMGGLPGKARTAIGDVAVRLFSAGAQLLQGFIGGIKSKVQGVIDTVAGAVGDAISKAKSLLGIRSPSRVFAEFGRFTILGFAQGIDKTGGKAQEAIDRVFSKLGADTPDIELGVSVSAASVKAATADLAMANSTVAAAPESKVTQLTYYAAPNQSLDSQTQLWEFMRRKTALVG